MLNNSHQLAVNNILMNYTFGASKLLYMNDTYLCVHIFSGKYEVFILSLLFIV